MATMVRTEYTATRFGWWLGQALRATVAALLLGGLLGAALAAARTVSVTDLLEDLDRGQVAEIVLTDSGAYGGPEVWDNGSVDQVVRWKVVGSGWRSAVLSADFGGGGDDSDGLQLGVGRDAEVIRARAQAAGVPVTTGGGGPAHTLTVLASLTAGLLVLVLAGGPQPRRATKWAWFWLVVVPGGVGALAWVALEAPWASGANRRPEPLPHARQPEDSRLTGGRAFVIAGALALVGSGLGTVAADWLAR